MMPAFKLKSLQEFCFRHITTNLEQYSTDVLSLLPKKFRERLLCNVVPVLDVCRLEECSSFTIGIDMESLWEKFYSAYISRYCYKTPELTWRELFFKRLFDAVIQGDRPYGYFHVLSGGMVGCSSVSVNMTKDRPVSEHDVDFVNFLVATKIRNRGTRHVSVDEYETMTRHEVTLINGSTPPGQTYHKSCCINQLVPPRYKNLFPEGSCYLPDSIALRLITEKCHYRPKHLHIDEYTFGTFILNVENDCGSLDCLRSYFEGVESVSIQGVIEASRREKMFSDVQYGECKGLTGRVLELILQTPNPVLSSLEVSIDTQDNVLESIEPVLARYGGLKKFALKACEDISLDFSKPISITEHQPLLNTLSISIHDLPEVYNPFHTATSSPVFAESQFLSWIQVCLKLASLQKLKLCIESATTQLVIQIMLVFLSTPCSREQTLFLETNLGKDRPKASKPNPTPTTSLQVHSNDPTTSPPAPCNDPTMSPVSFKDPPVDFVMSPVPSKEPVMSPVPSKEPTMSPVPSKEPTMSPVPSKEPAMSPVPSKEPTMSPVPVPTQPSVLPTYPFDDTITLKYKCLSLSTTPCSQEQAVSLETPCSQEQSLSLETPCSQEQSLSLETPCSQKQALSFSIPCSQEQSVSFSIPCSQEKVVSLKTNEDRPKSSIPNPRLTTPPPVPAQSSIPLTYYQIDDAVTLKYKCLVFDSCTVHDFFIEAFLSLAPLKLKKISFNEVSFLHDCTLLYRLAADPLIEMETLELLLSELPDQKKEFLEPLSLKKLLKSVKFSCLRQNAQYFEDVTFKHFDKKLVSDTPKEKTYVFSLCS